jgi:hypothetical protein
VANDLIRTKVLVHLAAGQTITTFIDFAEDLEEDECLDALQRIVETPPKPHWCQLGSALVFTQAIAGLELG